MGISAAILFITFSSLTLLTLIQEERRTAARSRTKSEWIADISGLGIQGILIPLFPFMVVPVMTKLIPSGHGILDIPPALQFLISFIGVDYLYYWNHRFFHKRSLWALHRLHHSCRFLDLIATSRNSLITSFLFVYVWAQILGMYLLKDSTPFMLGLGLTFALDLWRHSGMRQPVLIKRLFGWCLILPEQHVLHHSLNGRTRNYGANLCWWDKIHGTYSEAVIQNNNLERLNEKNVWNELLIPWRSR